MEAPISYRPMTPGEEASVCDLATRVFDELVAPGFSPAGIQVFRDYAKPDPLARRSQTNHFVLVAEASGAIAGMIEIRDYDHVSLFYVDKRFQRRGIGRALMQRALDICRVQRPGVTTISVNSSPYAAPVYEKLGFRRKGPEQEQNGIRFVPMVLEHS